MLLLKAKQLFLYFKYSRAFSNTFEINLIRLSQEIRNKSCLLTMFYDTVCYCFYDTGRF